jgi:hypothetical protein
MGYKDFVQSEFEATTKVVGRIGLIKTPAHTLTSTTRM